MGYLRTLDELQRAVCTAALVDDPGDVEKILREHSLELIRRVLEHAADTLPRGSQQKADAIFDLDPEVLLQEEEGR